MPCHKQRSWFDGFQRIRSFATALDPNQTDDETCVSYLSLTWDFITKFDLPLLNNE